MKEKDLYRAVDKLLPLGIHRQSMTGATATTNGTPDRYYDGLHGDLWVEYKMLATMPRNGVVVGKFTPLQLAWMERRYRNSTNLPHGPNVIGVVGLPNRKAVIQRSLTEWREGSRIETAVTIREVSEWIQNRCGASSARSPLSRPM